MRVNWTTFRHSHFSLSLFVFAIDTVCNNVPVRGNNGLQWCITIAYDMSIS